MIKKCATPGILSGLLLGTTLIGNGPFFYFHWFVFFGFLPLWTFWLRGASLAEVFFSGWICQFTLGLVAFHWVAYTVNEFSRLGTGFSILVMLFYCALANIQFPIAGWLWKKFFCAPPFEFRSRIAALAILTAISQRLGTGIFHWNFGYAWYYMGWPAAQLADIAGFRWLCSISICLNGIFVAAWLHKKSLTGAKYFLCGTLVFIGLNFLGTLHFKKIPPTDALARFLIIQPGLTNEEKKRLDTEKNARELVLEKYFSLTDQALATVRSKPDFVTWPENAFPEILLDQNLSYGLAPKMRDFISSRKISLITGGFGVKLLSDKQNVALTNSIYAINSSGKWEWPEYHKQILLPFGEYIPGASAFPFLKRWLPDVRDFAAGDGPVILKIGKFRIGAQICYEGLFDSIARDIALTGAQLIVNATNDSWYGTWLEPWQHFYVTMAKAVETRRPLLRTTNSGISAVAFLDGTISPLSPVGSPWFSLVEIPYYSIPQSTIFMRWGFWLDWVFLLSGFLLLILPAIARSKNSFRSLIKTKCNGRFFLRLEGNSLD